MQDVKDEYDMLKATISTLETIGMNFDRPLNVQKSLDDDLPIPTKDPNEWYCNADDPDMWPPNLVDKDREKWPTPTTADHKLVYFNYIFDKNNLLTYFRNIMCT